MKKLFFSLVMATMALMGSVAYAQTEVQSATLQQKDKTTVYYGPAAFVDAFNAVKDSADIITLSSGTFRATTVNKSVTIYGAGFELNKEKGIYPTVIDNFKVMHIITSDPEDPNIQTKNKIDGIHIEGIRMNTIDFGEEYQHQEAVLSNLTLKRCFFENLRFNNANSAFATTTNTNVINCVISSFYVDTYSNNFAIYNSIINNLEGRDEPNSLLVKNCILFQRYSPVGTFKDNIILYSGQIGGTNEKSSYYEKNITREAILFDLVSDANKKDNWTGKTDIAIFGAEIGQVYNPQLTYAIKADAAKTYIGTDGTPVGLYGGYYPFTKTPSTPQIVSKAIDVQSTVDGKLKVSIKVEAQTEAPAKAPTQQ